MNVTRQRSETDPGQKYVSWLAVREMSQTRKRDVGGMRVNKGMKQGNTGNEAGKEEKNENESG